MSSCDGGKSIVTKVKTGLNSYKDFKLPVTDQSVAGYVALHKRIVNIRNVYDANELAAYSPHPNFLRLVDAKTGYRTRQMLVAPVVEAQTGDLVGVVQLINTRSGEPFPAAMEEGIALLCETLAIALRQRQRPVAPIRGKYDALIANAVISADELELARRSARRKNLDIETVLIDEFRVKPSAIGEALAAYFDVPYEPFRADRVKPFDLLKNLSREFLESSAWVPIDDTKDGMVVLTTDPERLRGSCVVNNVYPKGKISYRVCCNREFATTLDQLFGATTNAMDRESIGDLLSDMQDDGGERGRGGHEVSGGRQRGRQARQQGHRRRVPAGGIGHPHRALSGQGQDRDPLPQGRTAAALHLRAPWLSQRDRGAHQDHVRPRHLRAAQAPGRQDQVQEVRAARHRAARRHGAVAGRAWKTS